MNEQEKKSLLQAARAHIDAVRLRIHAAMSEQTEKSSAMSKAAVHMMRGDAIAQYRLAAHRQEQAENLKQLYPSPYFTRCDFLTKGEKKQMYFGKFSFSEQGIYSWITPAATLRFEEPGETSYTRPDGSEQKGTIERKDQYMIVDGKLLFFSTEGVGRPRELIHQEHFTRQKSGFILPEVVEQMEKAQDHVIRAPYRGPLSISGPAGSGKTTLALHRVAYLMQSPETAEFFQPRDILVLVQDSGTKAYFSQLLPDLGIDGVTINTFSEWAFSVLGLTGYTYSTDYGEYEDRRVSYEYAKFVSIKHQTDIPYTKKVFDVLRAYYTPQLTSAQQSVLRWQIKNKMVDRFDLTVLLQAYFRTHGKFEMVYNVFEELSNHRYRKKKITRTVRYNLLVIDEYQNYTPEQLAILTSCINDRLHSVVYVGDPAQQTQLGTLRSSDNTVELVPPDRRVVLQKVYRNTKQILAYIRSRGFDVEIPDSLKDGPAVETKHLSSVDEQIESIQSYRRAHPSVMVGVLARDKKYLEPFKNRFADEEQVRALSFYEAQGVEFDTVFIVHENTPNAGSDYPTDLQKQVERIERDLLYVALTRAMQELFVLTIF